MAVYQIIETKGSSLKMNDRIGFRQKSEINDRVTADSRPGSILRNNPDYKSIMATVAAEAMNEGTATK